MPAKAKEVAEDVVEEVVEELRELPGQVLDIPRRITFRKEWLIPAAIAAGAVAVGAGAGYLISRARHNKTLDELEKIKVRHQEIDLERADQTAKFNHMMSQMTAVMNDFRKQAIGLVGTDAALQEDLDELSIESEDEGETSRVNVFRNAVEIEDWDYDAEVAEREKNPNAPHIISSDEFFNDENENSQVTLTYYEGDDILCDDKDVPIYNREEVVGELKFGHGSRDPNTVYIRNPKFEAEYEVIRDRGHYAVEILGNEIETHMDDEDSKPIVQKFRKE